MAVPGLAVGSRAVHTSDEMLSVLPGQVQHHRQQRLLRPPIGLNVLCFHLPQKLVRSSMFILSVTAMVPRVGKIFIWQNHFASVGF